MRTIKIFALVLIGFSCHTPKSTVDDSKINKNNPSETKTLYVASYKKDCEGVGKKTCYLVKQNPEDEWELFYNEIEGFNYVAGKVYTITVEIIPVKNPPADASMFRYKLVSVDRTDVPDYIRSGLYDIWGLVSLNGKQIDLKEQPVAPMIEINTREKTLTGSTGCNRFNSTFEYSMEDHSFRVSFPIAMTKRGCPKNGVEKGFLDALERVNGYSKKGVTLFLLVDGETVMEFRKMD